MSTHVDDDRAGDSAAQEFAQGSSGKRRSGNGPSNLLYGIGILMFIGAGALMTVPGFVPQVAWVFKLAAKHGITSGPLFLCGLSLCAMGWIARAVIAQRNEEDESQQRLLFEQLASDLALVRAGLDALKGDVVRLNVTSQSVLALAESNETDDAAQNQQDAIFRLAASLDQVGAHLDHRIQTQHTALATTVQELSAAIAAVREQVAQLAAPPMPTIPIEAQVHGSQDQASSIAIRPAISISAQGQRENGLGLLDTLDDNGESQGTKTSLRVQPIAGHGDRAHEILAHGPQAPLPADRNGKIELKAQHAHRAPAAQRIDAGSRASDDDEDFSTRDKLELLRSLMDDVRVREALGSLMGADE
jgi:hypothetical protein